MAAGDTRPGPLLLGLTGPIGCGKSTVGDVLLDLGALERIDADRVVHELMVPGTPVTRDIENAFGQGVIAADGSVDRQRVAAIVFSDPVALQRLEAITHPAVREVVRARLDSHCEQGGVVVVDAVKLLQSELLPLMDVVWVIRCSPEAQMRRLTQNRGMTPEAARQRVAAQPKFAHPRVTTVIENSGSLEELRQEVERMWERLLNE